jgi:hypothetical protein
MYRKLRLIVLLLSLTITAIAQDETQPFQMQSIFTGDTCAPPCWFGITPEISTDEDVQAFIEAYEDMLTPDNYYCCWNAHEPLLLGERAANGYLDEGTYIFKFRYEGVNMVPFARYSTLDSPGNTYINILNGHVNSIWLEVYEHLRIDRVLEQMGQPDMIFFQKNQFGAFYELKFIYLDELINITFTSVHEERQNITCDWGQWRDHFWVNRVTYFSHDAAFNQNTDSGLIRLFGDSLSRNARVPWDMFQSWLNADILTCAEARETVRRLYVEEERKG